MTPADLLAHLGNSADTARSLSDIAEAAGVSRRAVEKASELLAQSVPLIACSRGVYVAQDASEARAYAESPRGRIVALQARITALEKWAEVQELSGQATLWEAA